MAYESNTTHTQLARELAAAGHVALTTHQRPDGDALGSVIGLSRALGRIGVEAVVYLVPPIDPPGLRTLIGQGDVVHEVETSELPDDYDRIVVTDTGAWTQLETLEPWLRRHHEKVLGLDHHVRGDDVAARRIVASDAASTTQMMLPLLDAMQIELTGDIAEPLFAGLATDTGWFRYSNADGAAFAAAARLLGLGVDKTRLFQAIEETDRPQRLQLAARALGGVQYACDEAVAIMSLGLDDFAETGGGSQDLTGLVNFPMSVETVRVSILLSQLEEGRTKISFRSKPPLDDAERERLAGVWDVNVLAQQFGGGGHVHASGARYAAGVEETRARVVAAIEDGRPS